MNEQKAGIAKQITLLVIIVCIINVFCSCIVAYTQLKQAYIQSTLEQNTDLAKSVADSFRNRSAAGQFPLDEAKDRALKVITDLRFEGGNYLWVTDLNDVMLAHPTVPRGSNTDDITDKSPSPKHHFKEMNDKVRASSNGSAFEDFMWTKPGSAQANKPYAKYAYGTKYPDWGWIIASGVYVEDMNRSIMGNLQQIILVNVVAVIFIIIGVQLLFVRRLTGLLNNIAGALTDSTVQVSDAATSLEDSSQKLAEGTNEQAASVQEIAATVEESASMISKNDENTNYAAKLAKQTKDRADQGYKEMNELMGAMDKINISSQEISKIIKVIDNIAFQTNILALNAAVEAEKAGEAGKGFAVVAEEVRNLAQRSAQAAKDTTSLIESNVSLYEDAAKLSQHVHKSIADIEKESTKVSELINEVASATHEQKIGISQIHTAIAQVEQVLQVNSQTAEETSTDSQQLSSQTMTLNDLASRLTAIVRGK